MVSVKLRELKDAKGITNRELSDLTGIPESTIARIMAGQTENPSYSNIADIVTALGGSLDDIAGIPHPVPKMPEEVTKLCDQVIAMNERLDAQNTSLMHIQHIMQVKDKWIKTMFVYCCIITFLLVVFLAIDAFIPSFGMITR